MWGFNKSPQIKATSTVGITDLGKRQAQRYTSSGSEFALLASLEDKSPQSVGQIASDCDMTTSEALQRLKVLARQGYVRFTNIEV